MNEFLQKMARRSLIAVAVALAVAACTTLAPPRPSPPVEPVPPTVPGAETPPPAKPQAPPTKNPNPPANVNLQGFPLPYRQGYADGCASVGSVERKDAARFQSDGQYRTGWQDGNFLCKKK